MTKQRPRVSASCGTGTPVITRRNVLAMSAAAATSLYLPTGFISTARAQTSGEQYNQSVIGQLPDFYISPTGMGSASVGGTAADPWPITMLNDATAVSRYRGKIIGLMDGTYGLYNIMGLPAAGGFSGWNLIGVVPGTAAQPTTVVSQTPQGAIIDGQRDVIYAAAPTLDWGQGLLGPATASYGNTGAGVTIDGLKFVGANYRCITNYGGYGRGGFGNNGCDNLTVRNCWFADQSYITCRAPGRNAAMLYSEGQNHIYVQNCRFDQGSSPSDSNREALVQFYSPTQDTIVEHCTCTSPPAGANGIYWKAGPTPGHQDAVARYNYVDSSLVTALGGSPAIMTDGCLVTSDTFQIYNNVLIPALGAPAIWFDNTGVDGFQGTWDFYNNTIVGNWSSKGMIYSTDNWRNEPAAVNFYNNIVAPSAGGGQSGDFQVPAISEIGQVNYNLYPITVHFGVGNFSTYATLASWQSATSKAGHAADVNSAQGNPLFVATGTAAAYFQLLSGSPALRLAADGGEIGAWRSASQIGSTIGGGTVLARPDPPQLSVG